MPGLVRRSAGELITVLSLLDREKEFAMDGPIELAVSNAHDLDRLLDDAVTKLQEPASHSRSGILVTRLSPGRYTVSISNDVPCGMTRELML